RARELLGRGTRAAVAQARAMHKRALEIDPNFAAPYAGLSLAAVSDYINAWVPDPAKALEEAEVLARRAVALNEQDPVGHMALGGVLLWQRKYDAALKEQDRVIELDPNYAQGHAFIATALMYAGRAEESLGHFATAKRLDPHHSNMLFHLLAQAHFSLGQYEEAAAQLLERIARNPSTDASRMLLAACYGHLGRRD